MSRKSRKLLSGAFGTNEAGLIDLPTKIGNRRVSRLVFGRSRGGCSYCFPHGYESTNSTVSKNRRSWKHHRPSQFQARGT